MVLLVLLNLVFCTIYVKKNDNGNKLVFARATYFSLRARDSLSNVHIVFMTFPTIHLDDLIPAFRLLRTIWSPQIPVSISGESSSVSLFSLISSKNFKFTLCPSEEICKKLFLSSSLIPDMKPSWISVAVAHY